MPKLSHPFKPLLKFLCNLFLFPAAHNLVNRSLHMIGHLSLSQTEESRATHSISFFPSIYLILAGQYIYTLSISNSLSKSNRSQYYIEAIPILYKVQITLDNGIPPTTYHSPQLSVLPQLPHRAQTSNLLTPDGRASVNHLKRKASDTSESGPPKTAAEFLRWRLSLSLRPN